MLGADPGVPLKISDLSECLSQIAEAVMCHQKPFDQIQYTSSLDEYLPIIRGMAQTSEEEVRLEKAVVSAYRAQLAGKQVPSDVAVTIEPLFKKRKEKWFEDLQQQKPRTLGFPEGTSFKDVELCAERCLRQRLPNFKREKAPPELHDPAVINFAAPYCSSVKVLIRLDRGTVSPYSFTPYLGVSNPAFEIKLNALLGNAKDRDTWCYSSLDECKAAMDDLLGIVEKLLPIFEEKIHEADQKGQTRLK